MELAPYYSLGFVVPEHMITQVIQEYIDVTDYVTDKFKMGDKLTVGERMLYEKVNNNLTRLPFGRDNERYKTIVANIQLYRIYNKLGYIENNNG